MKYLQKFLLRVSLPVATLIVCAHLLAPKITSEILSKLPELIANIPPSSWLIAVILSAISLWTVGRYDAIAHQYFQTRIPGAQAQATGTIAIAIAQVLGFGLVTGAIARWRMLRDVSLITAFKLSSFVSVTFMLNWFVVTGLICLILPAPDWTFWPALGIVLCYPILLVAMFLRPVLSFKGRNIRVPSLKCHLALFFWTMLDMLTAAGALFVLMPSGVEVSFLIFFPVFLIALGSALFSNTPGGVGMFELMLLSLFEHLPTAEILGGILAFRLVYYALPAILALVALLRPFQSRAEPIIHAEHQLQNTGQAEVQVIAQNGGRILVAPEASAAVWPTAQMLIALCNPLAGKMENLIQPFINEAKTIGKTPFFYKCNAKSAAVLRHFGWVLLHVSDDALLSSDHYDISRPAYRRLRRKLRAAQKAEVEIHSGQTIPWVELDKIDKTWQKSHGKARGGTMGRFDPQYLSTHLIVWAKHKGKTCAFITFQKGCDEWCLDVMRHDDETPDGTMFALVHQAILLAKQSGMNRTSLAATPACPDPNSAFFRWAARIAVEKAGGTGLRQFKSCFAPDWVPRYAAAPTKISLLLGLSDITREIHHPPKIPQGNMPKIHDVDENYEVDSRIAS